MISSFAVERRFNMSSASWCAGGYRFSNDRRRHAWNQAGHNWC